MLAALWDYGYSWASRHSAGRDPSLQEAKHALVPAAGWFIR